MAKFKLESISAEHVQEWSTPSADNDLSSMLHLPPKNVFIASDFSLRREASAKADGKQIWREATESVSADPTARGFQLTLL